MPTARRAGCARCTAACAASSPSPRAAFPAGTPFAADDPELLLWVLASLVDSALVVYERYVSSLSWAERDAYWQDYRVIGRLFGLKDDEMPADIDAFDDYMHDMLTGDVLFVTPAARELAIRIVMRPPVPLIRRPVLELVNFITVGLLPSRLRRQYGSALEPPPVPGAARRSGVREARARAAGAGGAALHPERAGGVSRAEASRCSHG